MNKKIIISIIVSVIVVIAIVGTYNYLQFTAKDCSAIGGRQEYPFTYDEDGNMIQGNSCKPNEIRKDFTVAYDCMGCFCCIPN